jgi:hypothetical protein
VDQAEAPLPDRAESCGDSSVNVSQSPETDIHVASTRSMGTAMEGWDTVTVTGSGSWAPVSRGADADLPPLRLKDA